MVCKVTAVRDVFCLYMHVLTCWIDMHSKKIMFLIPANFPHPPWTMQASGSSVIHSRALVFLC